MLRKLGKYELLEEIGHGGMATVYRARDVNLQREVAVKVMHPHLRKTPEARVRFTREARSVARLKHPNVLEIYDYGGEDEEEAFIAAELLTGPTLKDFVEAAPALPAEVAACFGILIARALAAAHEKGIVHRDVKPENVLLHEDRTVKLTDFGIAQMVDAQSFTATGQILGSPGHMAPEQIEGGHVDPRTDVFSLGTVIYFVALRRLPFTGRNPHQVLKRIVDGEYPDPLRMDPAIGARFAELIQQAMARDPEQRFATAAEVEAALGGYLDELGIDDPSAMLVAYLKDPEGYSTVHRQRMLDRLMVLAREAVARDDRQAALRHCNRVLALDDGNEEALALVEKLGRSSRRPQIVAAALAVLVVGAVGAYAATRPGPHGMVGVVLPGVDAGVTEVVPEDMGPPRRPDSGQPDTGTPSRIRPITAMANVVPRDVEREVRFAPRPQNVQIAVDGGEFRAFGPAFRSVQVLPGTHRFQFRGPDGCCEEVDISIHIPPDREPFVLQRALPFRDAPLVVRSNVPARVEVAGAGGAPAVQGRARQPINVPMTDAFQNRQLTVTGDEGGVYTGIVRLQAGKPAQVSVSLQGGPPP